MKRVCSFIFYYPIFFLHYIVLINRRRGGDNKKIPQTTLKQEEKKTCIKERQLITENFGFTEKYFFLLHPLSLRSFPLISNIKSRRQMEVKKSSSFHICGNDGWNVRFAATMSKSFFLKKKKKRKDCFYFSVITWMSFIWMHRKRLNGAISQKKLAFVLRQLKS